MGAVRPALSPGVPASDGSCLGEVAAALPPLVEAWAWAGPPLPVDPGTGVALSGMSHCSLSASGLFLSPRAFTTSQTLALMSTSLPRFSLTSIHFGRPMALGFSEPHFPFFLMGARWHHCRSGRYVRT